MRSASGSPRCASARASRTRRPCLVLGEHDLSRADAPHPRSRRPEGARREAGARAQCRPSAGEVSGRPRGRRRSSGSSRCCCSTRRRSPRAPSSPTRPTTCSGSTACWCGSPRPPRPGGLTWCGSRRSSSACCSQARPGRSRRSSRRRPIAGASASAARGSAVVCHPHPLFGGTLDNKVVWTRGARLRGAGRAGDPLQFPRRRRAAPAPTTRAAVRPRTSRPSSPTGASAGRGRRCGSAASPSAGWWRCAPPPQRSAQRLVLDRPGHHQDRRDAGAARRRARGCWCRAMPTRWCRRRRCSPGRRA